MFPNLEKIEVFEMRATHKSRPLPVDPHAEAQETERREALAANAPHTERVRQAEAQELANRRGELTASFADLQRMKSSQGNLAAARAGYDRVYQRIERLATLIAGLTGESIEVPDYDPLAVLSTKTRVIGPPPSTAEVITRPDGSKVTVDTAKAYRESKGMGKSGKGGPGIPIQGSAADWVQK
jgi:hypothetical protein